MICTLAAHLDRRFLSFGVGLRVFFLQFEIRDAALALFAKAGGWRVR